MSQVLWFKCFVCDLPLQVCRCPTTFEMHYDRLGCAWKCLVCGELYGTERWTKESAAVDHIEKCAKITRSSLTYRDGVAGPGPVEDLTRKEPAKGGPFDCTGLTTRITELERRVAACEALLSALAPNIG